MVFMEGMFEIHISKVVHSAGVTREHITEVKKRVKSLEMRSLRTEMSECRVLGSLPQKEEVTAMRQKPDGQESFQPELKSSVIREA